MTRMFIFAALSAFLSVPASAEVMKCTSENMAKTTTMMQSMQDGPGKMAMGKEMGMANMEMSKGDMRKACKHYMNAQKVGSTNSSPGGMKM